VSLSLRTRYFVLFFFAFSSFFVGLYLLHSDFICCIFCLWQLWPSFFTEETLPPYVCLTGSTTASTVDPSSVLCKDRLTGFPRILSLYAEVRSVLRWCAEQDIALSVVCRSSNYEGAQSILRCLGLWDRLSHPQVYRARKTYHLRNLRECAQVDYGDMLYFDDDTVNVSASAGMGVCSCLVSRSRGLDGAALLKGLQLFAAHRERLKQHLEHAEEQEQEQQHHQQHHQQRAMEAVSHVTGSEGVVGTAVAARQHRSGVVSGVPVDGGGGGGGVGVAGAGGAGVAEGQWGMDDESFSEVLAIFAEGRFGPGTMHASWDDEEDDVNGGGRGVVSGGGAGGGFFGFPGKGQVGGRGMGRLAARVDLCVGEDSADWEGRAALLLQEARPLLVVLDLDYTVSQSESESE
jgi:hypothetical protein